eukprot:XP_014060674.1 PREDICTED: mucin-17-like isoform X2 [Salmo salar]
MSLRPKLTTTTTAPVARKTHAVSRAVTSPQGSFPWRPVDVGNSSDAEDVESFPAAASASLSNRKKNQPMAPPHWIPLSPSRENSNSSTVNWTEPLEEYTSGSEPFIYDLDLGDDPFSLFQYDSSYSLDEGLALAASGPQNLSHAGTGVSTEGPGCVTVSDPVTAMGGGEHLHNQSEPSLPQEALAGGALAEAGREARTGEQGVVVAAHSSWAQIHPFSTTLERTGVQMDQARPGSSFSEQTAERTTQSLSNIATQSPSLLTVAKLCFSDRVGITTDNDPTMEVSIPKDYTPTPSPSPISIPTTSAMPNSLWTAVITEIPAPNSLPTTPTIPLPTSPHPAFSPSSVHSMEQGDVSHSGHVRPAATETETLLPSMEIQRHVLMREGTRPSPLSLSVPTDAATALTPVLEKTYLSSSGKHHSDLVLPSLRNQLSSFLTNSHPVDGMVPSESIASESGSQSEGISLYSPLALEPSSYMSSVSDSVLGSLEGQEGFNPLSSNLRGFSHTSHLSVTPITEQLHHQALLPATVTDEWTFSQSSPPNTISPSRQEWRDALRTTFSLVSLSSDLLSETDLPEQLNITTVTEWESADGMERHSARQEGEKVHMSPISGSSSSPSLISLFRPSTQSEPSVAQLGHHGTSHINDDGSEYLSQTSLHLYSLLAPSRPLTLPTPLISSTASEYGSVVTHEPQRHAYMHELGWKRPVSGLGSVIHTDTHTPVSEPLSTMTSRADQLMSDASEALLFHRPMTTNPPRIREERLLPTPTPTPLPTHIPPLSGTLSAGAANMADSGAGASLPTRSTAAFQQSSTLIGSQSKPTQPAGTDGTLAWHGESRESTVSLAAPDTQLTAAAFSNPTISAAIIQPTAVTRNILPSSASNIQLTTANKQPTVFPNIQSTYTSNSQPPMALNTYLAGAGPLSVPWRANHSEDTQGGKHGPALIDHTPSIAASTSVSSMVPGNNVTVNQNTNTDRETETQTTSNPLAVIGMDEQSFVATKGPYLPLTTPHRGVNAGSGTVSTTHATPQTSAGTTGTPVIAPCQCKARFHLSCLCGLSTGNKGLFYRISFVVNDKEAKLTESDVEKTVAQWLNQTFQNWTHVVYVDNFSIQPNSDSQLKRSASKKYTCQALLVYQTSTNVTLGEVAISTRVVGRSTNIGNGLELETVAVQSVENCPEETPLHYIWPESRPTVTQYVPCFPNKDQNTSRTCVISPLNYTAFWGAPDLSNCTDIDSINVSAENAAEVADQLADITNNELSTDEVSKVVDKVKELVNVAKINTTLATTVLNIISNVMTSSVSALAVASERTLKTVDELVQKLEFDGPSVSITSKNLALGISTLNHGKFNGTSFSAFIQPNTTDLQIDFESNQLNPLAQVTLPATLLKNLTDAETAAISRINFMFFSKIGLFQDKQDGLSLNSYVVASSVGNYSISNLQDPVEIEILHLNYQPKPKPTCMFWDFIMKNGSGGWNSKGCRVSPMSNGNKTICLCDHLTHFGILMDISGSAAQIDEKNTKILTFITYIGCGISAIFSAVTLLTYIAFEKLRRDYPSKILMNLSTSLLFLNMVFLLDGWLASFEMEGLCVAVAVFLHFFLLTSFTWMGLESIHMYIALVKVFNTYIRRYILKFCIVGWGLPAAIVATVVAIDKNSYGKMEYGKGETGQGSSEFCWIRSHVVFYVTCVGYFCVIFLLNVAMFIVVMIQICGRNGKRSNRTLREEVLRNLRSVISLTFLLGMTWGFAFFAWGPVNLAFMYLFSIFNSLQGLFIFIFHCALKENVQKQWRRYLCCGRFRLADNSDWSKTATNNTKKVSSDTVGKSLSSSSFGSSTANWTSKAKATLNPFAKRNSNADVAHQ